MSTTDFEFLEHTADISIRIHGKTIEELFINAVTAMFTILADRKDKKGKEEKRKISIKAENVEDLLIYWLNELLSLFYTYNFCPLVYNNIELKKKDGCLLTAEIKGAISDNIEIKTEIKAATYHNIRIEKEKGNFRVDIVFDV